MRQRPRRGRRQGKGSGQVVFHLQSSLGLHPRAGSRGAARAGAPGAMGCLSRNRRAEGRPLAQAWGLFERPLRTHAALLL